MPKRDDEPQIGRPPNPDSHRSRLERGEARQLTVIVSEDAYRALRVQAALTDRTMSDIVDEALREWLTRQEQ